MKHRIDPKIDCVFKALLGSVENRNLLVHFLNAILTSDLTAPITEAEILNPYNDKEFLDDKLSVVDVTKPKDSKGWLYQIEIQLLTYRHLPERMSIHGATSSASNCKAATTTVC
jgi:predicted transposase/invertase (TIGR01784 family)